MPYVERTSCLTAVISKILRSKVHGHLQSFFRFVQKSRLVVHYLSGFQNFSVTNTIDDPCDFQIKGQGH